MRSRSSSPVIVLLLAAALVAAPLRAQAPAPAPPPHSGPVGPDEIVRVLAKLESDPNIAPTRQMRVLQWESDPKEKKKRSGFWGWLRPVGELFSWIGQAFKWLTASSRLLVWIVAAVLIGFLAVFILRLIRSGALGAGADKFTAPSFVRDLDIRPESLPPDIGAAALALWEQGEKRGALALLYRGLLSRLVHVHSVPIRDSSTEGDCLALATQHLRAERVGYVSRLIRTWQGAVYGGIEVDTETVRSLCAEFSAALDTADAPVLQEAGQPA